MREFKMMGGRIVRPCLKATATDPSGKVHAVNASGSVTHFLFAKASLHPWMSEWVVFSVHTCQADAASAVPNASAHHCRQVETQVARVRWEEHETGPRYNYPDPRASLLKCYCGGHK